MIYRPLSKAGLDFIKSFEQCVLHVYRDQGKLLTCGWGHLLLPEDDLEFGEPISQYTADMLLVKDLSSAYKAVHDLAHVDLNDNQYDACVSLAYNAGRKPFTMTFGKLLNSKRYIDAANAMLVWNKVKDNGVYVVSNGLKKRRSAERAMFLKPVNEVVS